MRNFNFLILIMVCAAALLLVACVRPIPGRETPQPVESPAAPVATLPPEGGPIVPETPPETASTATPVAEVPAATPVPAATATPAGEQIHTVQPGDTLFKISQQYGVPVAEIMAANNLSNPNYITVGEQLIIPAPGSVVPTATAVAPPAQPTTPPGAERTHVVQRGENLFRIGLRYGCTVSQLAQYNGIPNPHYIYVGQVIRIPPSC